jgi:hypothetical protein
VSINDGGPAFPRPASQFIKPDQSVNQSMPCSGMTLRDWFATHATEEDILAAQGTYRLVTRYEARYIHADNMLKAREAKP